MSASIERVDVKLAGANMYGCTPCPQCGSRYRWPPNDRAVIVCDDCGHEAPRANLLLSQDPTERKATDANDG